MKKYILTILACLSFAFPSNAETPKEVVIFSQPCRFCEKMKDALNNGIIAANPDIKFTILDIQDNANGKLLRKLAAEHKLKGDIGLPLLFIGKNHMMGWGANASDILQEYIEDLKKENISRIPANSMLKNI